MRYFRNGAEVFGYDASQTALIAAAIKEGWTEITGSWPVAPVMTLADHARVALSVGLSITSTATPALNGVYAIDPDTQSHIMAEMIALLNSGGTLFADGSTSLAWPDTSDVVHTFNAAQAKAFFLAVGAYVAALYKVINGTSTTLPVATATIP